MSTAAVTAEAACSQEGGSGGRQAAHARVALGAATTAGLASPPSTTSERCRANGRPCASAPLFLSFLPPTGAAAPLLYFVPPPPSRETHGRPARAVWVCGNKCLSIPIALCVRPRVMAEEFAALIIGTSNTRTATLYRVHVTRPPRPPHTLLKSADDFTALHKALVHSVMDWRKAPPIPSLQMGYSFRSNVIARMECLNAFLQALISRKYPDDLPVVPCFLCPSRLIEQHRGGGVRMVPRDAPCVELAPPQSSLMKQLYVWCADADAASNRSAPTWSMTPLPAACKGGSPIAELLLAHGAIVQDAGDGD